MQMRINQQSLHHPFSLVMIDLQKCHIVFSHCCCCRYYCCCLNNTSINVAFIHNVNILKHFIKMINAGQAGGKYSLYLNELSLLSCVFVLSSIFLLVLSIQHVIYMIAPPEFRPTHGFWWITIILYNMNRWLNQIHETFTHKNNAEQFKMLPETM